MTVHSQSYLDFQQEEPLVPLSPSRFPSFQRHTSTVATPLSNTVHTLPSIFQILPEIMPLSADTLRRFQGRTTVFAFHSLRRHRRNRRTVQWFHWIARASSFPFHRRFRSHFGLAWPAWHSFLSPTSQGTLVTPVAKWRKNPGMAQPPCLQSEGKRSGRGVCAGSLSHLRHWRNDAASMRKKHPSFISPWEK